MDTDTTIIKDCLDGNQLAFKKLYEKYISYCYGICTRYAVNKSDMKDMVQVIFSQTFQSLKNFDSDRSQFKTWFTHVCINNILSYKKKQSRQFQTQSFDDFDESNNSYTANYIEENIDRQYILNIIKQMPNKYQIVFNLFIIDGFSHEEISKQLNISIAASRVTLNRARGWVKKTYVNNHLNS